MNKRWFTIIFSGPAPTLNLGAARLNSAGDWVAWDGWATLLDTQTAAHRLAAACREVHVFVGLGVGRLIATYRDGQYVA